MTKSVAGRSWVFASAIDPFSAESLADPRPHEKQLRKSAAVVWLEQYEVYALARYNEVHRALGGWDSFSSAAGVGMYDLRSGTHQRDQAKLLEMDRRITLGSVRCTTRCSTPGSCVHLRDSFGQSARTLISSLVDRGPFDAVPDLAVAYPRAVFPDMIGADAMGAKTCCRPRP